MTAGTHRVHGDEVVARHQVGAAVEVLITADIAAFNADLRNGGQFGHAVERHFGAAVSADGHFFGLRCGGITAALPGADADEREAHGGAGFRRRANRGLHAGVVIGRDHDVERDPGVAAGRGVARNGLLHAADGVVARLTTHQSGDDRHHQKDHCE